MMPQAGRPRITSNGKITCANGHIRHLRRVPGRFGKQTIIRGRVKMYRGKRREDLEKQKGIII